MASKASKSKKVLLTCDRKTIPGWNVYDERGARTPSVAIGFSTTAAQAERGLQKEMPKRAAKELIGGANACWFVRDGQVIFQFNGTEENKGYLLDYVGNASDVPDNCLEIAIQLTDKIDKLKLTDLAYPFAIADSYIVNASRYRKPPEVILVFV